MLSVSSFDVLKQVFPKGIILLNRETQKFVLLDSPTEADAKHVFYTVRSCLAIDLPIVSKALKSLDSDIPAVIRHDAGFDSIGTMLFLPIGEVSIEVLRALMKTECWSQALIDEVELEFSQPSKPAKLGSVSLVADPVAELKRRIKSHGFRPASKPLEIISVILPAGSGKTTISKKNGWIDVDTLIPENEHELLDVLRAKAVKTNDWEEYNIFFFNTSEDSLVKHKGVKVIFLHSYDHARFLGTFEDDIFVGKIPLETTIAGFKRRDPNLDPRICELNWRGVRCKIYDSYDSLAKAVESFVNTKLLESQSPNVKVDEKPNKEKEVKQSNEHEDVSS